MNPRIKEIADKSHVFYHFGISDMTSQDAKMLETFAAMILAECFAQVDLVTEDCDQHGSTTEALGAAWVGFAIEKHFKA